MLETGAVPNIPYLIIFHCKMHKLIESNKAVAFCEALCLSLKGTPKKYFKPKTGYESIALEQ